MQQFQHTAAQRWLQNMALPRKLKLMFQHTAARRRLRPRVPRGRGSYRRFNTQPREGGCLRVANFKRPLKMFQHTAARRRLPGRFFVCKLLSTFQHTAARRRLPKAGRVTVPHPRFNTQPREVGCRRHR